MLHEQVICCHTTGGIILLVTFKDCAHTEFVMVDCRLLYCTDAMCCTLLAALPLPLASVLLILCHVYCINTVIYYVCGVLYMYTEHSYTVCE